MHKELVLKRAEVFAQKVLAGKDAGHDWWHVARVLSNARLINKTEKADPFIVELAVLLHDVGDWKVIGKEEDDYSIAENFLKKQRLGDEVIRQVMFIIQHMSFSKSLNSQRKDASKEFYVVQDADRLDAIGAIGVARAFTYGGSRGRAMYDPTKKSPKVSTTKGYRRTNTSTLHHFEEKLLLLKDLMNTKTAQRIAKKRDSFMRMYQQQFLAEWNGER
jgi:uncharacterized protein